MKNKIISFFVAMGIPISSISSAGVDVTEFAEAVSLAARLEF